MYNDFVIVGPAEDPAGIKGEKSVTVALKKIMDKQVKFISRGDKSGTHVAEMVLWEASKINNRKIHFFVFISLQYPVYGLYVCLSQV